MNRRVLLGIWLCSFVAAATAIAQENPVLRQVEALPWKASPSVGGIAGVAQISLTGNLRFLDPASASRFLEIQGNPPRVNNYVLAPRSLDWFAVFGYDESGYIRDDEQLNPAELLRTLQRSNDASIEERRRLGLPILRLSGWAVEPHYDIQTRRLEWGTRLIGDDGSQTVNYTIRLLGRSGVVRAILVTNPQDLAQDIQDFRAALRGFDFMAGQRYTEFRQGDRVAEFGLAALVVGGAAAAAASSGVLKGFGKMIGIGAIAALAAVGAFFKRIFGKKTSV